MALGVAAAAGWAAGVPAGGQHAAEEAGTLNNMRPERQRTLDRAEWGRQGGQACCWAPVFHQGILHAPPRGLAKRAATVPPPQPASACRGAVEGWHNATGESRNSDQQGEGPGTAQASPRHKQWNAGEPQQRVEKKQNKMRPAPALPQEKTKSRQG